MHNSVYQNHKFCKSCYNQIDRIHNTLIYNQIVQLIEHRATVYRLAVYNIQVNPLYNKKFILNIQTGVHN